MIFIKKYLYPIITSLGILLIGTFIISTLYYFNILSFKICNILLYINSIISIFIGSYNMSQKLKYKGIINGLIFYMIFTIISLSIAVILLKNTPKINSLLYFSLLLISSIISALISKNIHIDENK